MQKWWFGCKMETSKLNELRIVVDTGVFCASASSELFCTLVALEIKGDLAGEKLRVVGCSQISTVRRKSLLVLTLFWDS